jgi:hypothetical protein
MLSSVFKRSSKKLKLGGSLKNLDHAPNEDAERGYSPRLKSSVAVAARQRILHEMVAKEHRAWAQVMHKDPAAASVDKSIMQKEAKLKDESAHRYEVRHLKQHNALLTLRLVVHARAGMKETCYLLEVEDSTDLYTVQRKVRHILGLPAGCRLKLLWLTAEGDTTILGSQPQWKAYLDHSVCTHPLVVHIHEPDLSSKDRAAVAKHRGSVMPARGSVAVAPDGAGTRYRCIARAPLRSSS